MNVVPEKEEMISNENKLIAGKSTEDMNSTEEGRGCRITRKNN